MGCCGGHDEHKERQTQTKRPATPVVDHSNHVEEPRKETFVSLWLLVLGVLVAGGLLLWRLV